MSEYICRYADLQGKIHDEVESAHSVEELRERLSSRGVMIYSIRRKHSAGELGLEDLHPPGRGINLEQFLIFNQQFVTLIRAGLPIPKSLDLLAGNIKNRKLRAHLEQIREDVKTGTPLSEAFLNRGVFPPIYTTSLMAGEKSGSLSEVIERYVTYQKVALSVRRKIIVSLIYPSLLVTLVSALILFLVTYVIPEFASLYASMDAELPYMTQLLVGFGVAVSDNLGSLVLALAAAAGAVVWCARSERVRDAVDRMKVKVPLLGQIWVKHQVSQFCRLLATLLQGGIPLPQALETTGNSLGSRLLQDSVTQARRLVQEGQSLSDGMRRAGIFPSLAVEMVHVGESTGALPEMLGSVAEFFDDDVNTMMTAALSLIEPAIMIFMGTFVAFVLISLYLPIFSLAETIR